MEKKCQHCWSIFKTNSNNRKYCSQKCFRQFRKGKTYNDLYGENKSKKIRDKQSKTAIDNKTHEHGKMFSKGHKINNGREPWNKGIIGGRVAWNKGLVMKNYFDEEQYKKFINGCIKGGVSACLTVSRGKTSIEKKLEEILDNIGVRYLTQYPILGITVSDAYLPDNHIVIYADGDYWHNYPHGTKKDHEITRELKNSNYRVLRFWEKEFKENIENIKQKIIREIQRL